MQKEVMVSESFSIEAFIFVIILLIYLLTSQIIQTKKIPYLHESTVAIFMGILTAIFAKYGLGKEIEFSNELFFTIILPPIIFSAGYNVRNSSFFQNFKLISLMGIAGSLLAFLGFTFFINTINTYLFKALTLKQVLLLSSVLCATDTVAAISLIKKAKFPVLSAIVFGQGIINDAIAIILFRTISEIKIDEQNQFTLFTALQITFDFTYMFAFSVAFGVVTGFGLSYLFKKIESFVKHPIKQASLILLNGYFTYLMSELLGLSGIIGLFTCAVLMGHYCFMNLSKESQRGTGLAFETVSYVAEAFVFAYLGASILAIDGKWQAVIMALFILLAMPVIRALMVFILPWIYKLRKIKFPLSSKELKVSWFNGMIRGAIAFALALQIQSKDKKYILTVSLVIVMITTVLGSTLLKKFKNYIGLTPEKSQPQHSEQEMDIKKPTGPTEPRVKTEQVESYDSSRPLADRLEQFELKFIKPIFTKHRGKKLNYELEDQEAHQDQLPKSQSQKQMILQL